MRGRHECDCAARAPWVVAIDANEQFKSRSRCCADCCQRQITETDQAGQEVEVTEYYQEATALTLDQAPQLERLLEAPHEKLTCPREEKTHRVATFERLLQDAFGRRPRTSRDELVNALQDRFREFCRARRKPPTLPPNACSELESCRRMRSCLGIPVLQSSGEGGGGRWLRIES